MTQLGAKADFQSGHLVHFFVIAVTFKCLALLFHLVLSGALQPSRKPLAHRVAYGNQEEAPRLCGVPGHDLLCWRERRHHGAEQRREIQPQDQPVVPCRGHDVQAERGVCLE